MEAKACQYHSKAGVRCPNHAMGSSKWCHLKRHHKNKSEYTDLVQQIQRAWLAKTISPRAFEQNLKAPRDGWCFFFSAARSLYHLFQFRLKGIPKERWATLYEETEDPILRYFLQEDLVPMWESEGKAVERIRSIKDMSLIARHLQIVVSKWIVNHLSDKHYQSGESILDLLLHSHDISSVDEYLELFNEESKDLDELDETNWGAYCEQYALSQYFKVDLWVFTPYKFSLVKDRPERAESVSRGQLNGVDKTRLQLMSRSLHDPKKEGEAQFLEGLVHTYSKSIPDFVHVWEAASDTQKQQARDAWGRAVFCLLYLREDRDGDNISHYNALLLERYSIEARMRGDPIP
jgi:hypothetical protein